MRLGRCPPLPPRSLGLTSDDHDRAMGVADHVVRDRADQKPADAAAAVRANNYQIRVLRVRGGDDRLARIAVPDQECGIGPGSLRSLDDRLSLRREGVARVGWAGWTGRAGRLG